MTETLEHTETEVVNLIDFMPYDESKDPDRRTHIINPPANVHIWQEGMTAKEIVDIARATDITHPRPSSRDTRSRQPGFPYTRHANATTAHDDPGCGAARWTRHARGSD